VDRVRWVSRQSSSTSSPRVAPSLVRSGYLLTGDRGHAEDLAQVTLWRTARHWDALSGSPDAYAHEVLVNLSRDRRRSLGRRPARSLSSIWSLTAA
jgi:DNA-directed RNA polymerase specialized sigma24 family protein